MIGDGMGTAHVYADITAQKGHSNFQRFPVTGFSMTYSASDYTTESAAGSTALATGVKTHNRAIGVDKANRPLPNIREIAQKQGKATGIVVTTDLTDATPADFIAHVPDRDMHYKIAQAYVQSGVQIFIGAEKKRFYNPEKGIDLIPQLKEAGYQICNTLQEIQYSSHKKMAGLLKEQWQAQRGDQGVVTAMKAIDVLNDDPDGFFLMIEGSKIDGASHDNRFDRMLAEIQDFDQVIGKVLDFAAKDKHTLVIVTADHETGGLVLTEGDKHKGTVAGEFMFTHHTPVLVPVFAYGPGAEQFAGINENNSLFQKMMTAFGFNNHAHKQSNDTP